MAASDLIFVLGRERSGTTVLRLALAAAGALDCDEIMHADLTRRHRFWAYAAERIAAEPRLAHPQHHPRLFRDYIDRLRAEAAGRPLAMDVKYWGLSLVAVSGEIVPRPPFLIRYMRHQRAHVVHLARRNKLRQVLSREIARASGRWAASRPEHQTAPKPKVDLPPAEIVAQIERLAAQEATVRAMLAPLERVRSLVYEEMFTEGGAWSQEIRALVAEVTGGAAPDRPAHLRQNPEPVAELVADPEALARALAPTPHAWMLQAP